MKRFGIGARLLGFALVCALGVAGCSTDDPSNPLRPGEDPPPGEVPDDPPADDPPGDDPPADDPPADDPTDPAPIADLSLFLVDSLATTRDAVLTEYDFELVQTLGGGRMVLVDGTFDADDLIDDPRVLAFQTDGPMEFSSPVELTMSFYEGDFDSDLPAQDAFAAWNLDEVHASARGAGVKVAVLDTGVDPTHPLLAGRVQLIEEGEWGLGSIEIEQGVDTDGDGVFDEAYGHGTHVAGIVASVAPGAEILSIRVLDSDGVGTAFDLARGLYRAAAWGADIVNLSLVLSDEAAVIEEILDELEDDMVIVGAAGNRPGAALYPASDDEVVSIAALDAGFALAGFSAASEVDLAAPGVGVLSAFPGGRWASATGTSMATGSASGALAVVAGLLGETDDVDDFVEETARRITASGLRSIDLPAAVLSALSGDDD
ncbi:MAG TPA: S8 family serine peptidase [Candidatus Krumholzibacteria bacterium]|nr:S8 family serine peptidase [Candidatus Krumholzibacteria bacterium]